jgi:transcriptional regulator with XRE-family HTH domain
VVGIGRASHGRDGDELLASLSRQGRGTRIEAGHKRIYTLRRKSEARTRSRDFFAVSAGEAGGSLPAGVDSTLMLDMSQTEIADALGLTFQQVQKYEKGANRISASRLQHLSQILQVPVPFFFEGAPAASAGPAAQAPADDPSYVADFLATSDGLALVKAFVRIEDQELRRAIVRLVEEIEGV